MNSSIAGLVNLVTQVVTLGLVVSLLSKVLLAPKDKHQARHLSTVTEAAIKEGVRIEAEWGEEHYGKKTWAKELWGRVEDGKITLFHGTGRYVLGEILEEGLKPSYAGWGLEPEEAEEMPPEIRPTPSVWLAYTPYLAFFFGDTVLQVTIPVSWITEANDGVLVVRHIPPGMIDRYLYIEDWK